MGPHTVTAAVAGRQLVLSNLDKTLWPADGLTKADLIEYYLRAAPLMLPHLKDRPLVLTRYPDGIHGKWFYQKDLPEGAPAWVQGFAYQHAERVVTYVLADEPATLVWLANLAAIEMHPWLSRRQQPEEADFAVIDLDPAEGATFADVCRVAMMVRQVLDSFGLTGFPKHSGATGLHIYVPLQPGHSYQDASDFVEAIGRLLLASAPEIVTMERVVAKRTGRVYVDYLQNRLGKTLTAVYGVRPRPGAPVSAPVLWQEIAAGTVPLIHIKNLWQRVEGVGDPFLPALTLFQDVRPATRALGSTPLRVTP